jgi:hypothetical protein
MGNVTVMGVGRAGKLCTVEKIFINLIFLNVTSILSRALCASELRVPTEWTLTSDGCCVLVLPCAGVPLPGPSGEG